MKAKDEEDWWEWKGKSVGGSGRGRGWVGGVEGEERGRSGRSPLRRDGRQISKAGMCCVSIHKPARTG